MFSRKFITICAASALAFGMANYASAAPYAQGYEVDDSGWNGTISRVGSGGGTLAVSSSSGSYHAELTNTHDAYGAGLGGGGYTYFGGADPVYQGPFFKRVDVYIDTSWTPGAIGYESDFWIDASPRNITDSSEYGAEHNFRMKATGSQVDVRIDSNSATPLTSLTASGWYTFEMVYRKGALPTDLIETDMNIYDASDSLVASTTVFATSPGGPSPSSVLGNNSYLWFPIWQNGFAGDILAIDNVETGLVPEPASLGLIAIGGLLLAKRRKHTH